MAFNAFLLFLLVLCAPIAFSNSENPPLLPTSLILPPSEELSRSVHVAILVDAPSVSIRVGNPFEILDASDGRIILEGEGPFEASVWAQAEGIQINGKAYAAESVALDAKGEMIQVGKRTYGGRIRILKASQNTVTVVNDVDLEEYVKGVLPVEVNANWPIESLKAHAVVSRTFALFKMIEKKGAGFALRDTVLGQVYRGTLFHQGPTDEAVEATRGQILTFEGRIFPTYFHASCGGRTAQADLVWPVEPHPSLSGRICPFCQGTKHYEWAFDIPLVEVEQIMQTTGYPAKNLKNITFLDYDVSGRARAVKLQYERSEVQIPASDFRTFLGRDRFRSLKADVEVESGRAKFHGFGWGHGVGFCQWGAKRQAEVSKSYEEILEFYFPESKITKN